MSCISLRVMDSAINEVFVGSWLSNYSTSMAWVTLVTTFHSQVSVQLENKATQQAATKTGIVLSISWEGRNHILHYSVCTL